MAFPGDPWQNQDRKLRKGLRGKGFPERVQHQPIQHQPMQSTGPPMRMQKKALI